MSTEQWLLLTDYSSKYRISVSTLRRRIKLQQLPYRFDNGKYFILDLSPAQPEGALLPHETPTFPELKAFAAEAAPLRESAVPSPSWSSAAGFSDQLNVDLGIPAYQPRMDLGAGQGLEYDSHAYETMPETFVSKHETPEPLITTATNLLNELKRAYSNILQEKEEQMIQLKEEVSDLKTLVRVLEDQVERMRRQLNEYRNS